MRRTGTVQSRRVFHSKKCYISNSGCTSSVSDGHCCLEWPSSSAVWSHRWLAGHQHVQAVLGYDGEWDPADTSTEDNKVRILTDDDGDYPRRLERWVLLWAGLVLSQVGGVWLTREAEDRWNTDVCHASDEPGVYGVHEATYPNTPLSEFKTADTYVRVHGGVDALDDDEDDE